MMEVYTSRTEEVCEVTRHGHLHAHYTHSHTHTPRFKETVSTSPRLITRLSLYIYSVPTEYIRKHESLAYSIFLFTSL